MKVSTAVLRSFIASNPESEAAQAIREQLEPEQAMPAPQKLSKPVTPVNPRRRNVMKYVLYTVGFYVLSQGDVIGGGLFVLAAVYLTKN